MKLLTKSLLIMAGVVSTFAATSVLADDSVHFVPVIPGQQYFECNTTAKGSYALQTHSVKLQGACPSGRAESISAETLNTSYFSVKYPSVDPSVDIIGPDVKCTVVKNPTKTNDFGAGQGFCALPPVGK
jgi:hypothetical protein